MVDVSDLIGIPYKDHGRTKEEGFDCYGLVIEVARRMGFNLPDVFYENHDEKLAGLNVPTLPLIKTDSICEGVILEMTLLTTLHIGICLDDKVFIHSTTNQGVRISKIGALKIRNMYGLNQSL